MQGSSIGSACCIYLQASSLQLSYPRVVLALHGASGTFFDRRGSRGCPGDLCSLAVDLQLWILDVAVLTHFHPLCIIGAMARGGLDGRMRARGDGTAAAAVAV